MSISIDNQRRRHETNARVWRMLFIVEARAMKYFDMARYIIEVFPDNE